MNSNSILSVVLVTGMLLASISNSVADQRDPELPALFAALEDAPTSSVANQIEEKIWARWLATEDTKAAELMRAVVSAMGSGDLDEAMIAANELVEYAPRFAEGWNKRATIYYLIGNFNASVKDIQQTVLLEPRHFGAISGLGLIFFRQGNLSAALEAFEQVLVVSPQSQNAKRSVEQVRGQLGDEI